METKGDQCGSIYEDASVEASAKPWKRKMYLLVLGPSSSHWSDDVQGGAILLPTGGES